MTGRTLHADVVVRAGAERVWEVVGDPRRTGEWSPECRRVLVLGRGPVRAGTRLVGVNRRGPVVWATTCRVHRYEPGAAIAWTVSESRTRWSYQLEPAGSGTLLVQRREADDPSPVGAWFARTLLGGTAEHDAELEQGMRAGLDRIRRIVEQG